MAIETKNLLVAVKAYARGNAIPLDSSEVHESLEAAQTYAKSATAYAGQTIKVLQNGKYETYVLNGSKGAYTLDKIGVDQSQLKNYVQVVSALPETSSAEQGVIYINTTDSKGYIYNGTEFKVVFEDVQGLTNRVKAIENKLPEFAKLAGSTFTGEVLLHADPTKNLQAATKQYVDRLVGGLNNFTVGVVDSTHALPESDYKVGQTFRVAEAGTYAGKTCEVGDLIIVISDFDTTQKNEDFLVVQANVDGTVTGPTASTDANIVVFDGITGKRIKDSTVTLASLQDAIGKAHEHANKAVLDSYDKSQTELLQAASDAVDTKLVEVNGKIETKADKTALSQYYKKTEIDNKLTPITENLNTKVTAQQVKEQINARLGEGIPDTTTVQQYIDTAVGSGGTASAEAIAKAKEEAIKASKAYTDASLTITEF